MALLFSRGATKSRQMGDEHAGRQVECEGVEDQRSTYVCRVPRWRPLFLPGQSLICSIIVITSVSDMDRCDSALPHVQHVGDSVESDLGFGDLHTQGNVGIIIVMISHALCRECWTGDIAILLRACWFLSDVTRRIPLVPRCQLGRE